MRLIAICLMLCSGLSYAATKHAPFPDAVLSAKTIFIVNKSGFQSTADGAYEAFTKWGAFTIVSDRAKADLIVTLTYAGDEQVHGTSTWGDFDMDITLRGEEDTVFSAASSGGGFYMPSARGGAAAKDCVNQFKKRFQEAH